MRALEQTMYQQPHPAYYQPMIMPYSQPRTVPLNPPPPYQYHPGSNYRPPAPMPAPVLNPPLSHPPPPPPVIPTSGQSLGPHQASSGYQYNMPSLPMNP